MIIRHATEADWEILKEIRLASLLDAPTAFGVSHASAAAQNDAQWRDRASNRGKARFLLALIDGAAVGMVGGVVSPTSEFNLIAMWVKPEHRGTAAAARLVAAMKAHAVSQGHARVVLEVAPDNARAAAFYRKQGFSFLPEWEALASHPEIKVQKMEWRAGAGAHPALRAVHRMSAMFIAVFALAHITNHLVALSSIADHIAFMETLRSVYRHRLVETVLLSCVTLQVLTGLWLVRHGWKQRQGKVAWLQAPSGAYLAFFLLVPVAAILFGRTALKLDTNFYYAAAGFYVPPFQFFSCCSPRVGQRIARR